MPRKKTTEQFIQDAKKVHGDRYDYSKVKYAGSDTKICVICSIHGEFWPTPNNHLNGSGCPYCAGRRLTRELFIEKAKEVHGDKYDYSDVQYVNSLTFVKIICPKHGEFFQKPTLHLQVNGCKECSGQVRMTTERFIRKAREVHGDKYDYSKMEVIGDNKTKVCVICPKCAGKYNDLEFFIERARKVHGDKYDYSKAEYVATNEKVCIICPEHGEFWQTPSGHMNGQGCPSCNQKHLERDVMLFLKRHKIRFEVQKTFPWLRYVRPLHLDFFLPDYSVAIECQGGQHFKAVDFYGGEEMFNNTVERDTIKKKLCEEHGIQMLYYSDLGIMYPYEVIEDFHTLKYAIEQRGFVKDTHLWKDPELPFEFD